MRQEGAEYTYMENGTEWERQVSKSAAGKRIRRILGISGLLLIMAGCGTDVSEMKKLRDAEYTVVAEPEIPEELREAIEEKKEEPFQFTYQSGEDLYLAKGYGVQQSSGYSIQAKELYVTEDCLVLDTELTGPGEGQKVQETNTYPYIVIKTEYMEKNVIFR